MAPHGRITLMPVITDNKQKPASKPTSQDKPAGGTDRPRIGMGGVDIEKLDRKIERLKKQWESGGVASVDRIAAREDYTDALRQLRAARRRVRRSRPLIVRIAAMPLTTLYWIIRLGGLVALIVCVYLIVQKPMVAVSAAEDTGPGLHQHAKTIVSKVSSVLNSIPLPFRTHFRWLTWAELESQVTELSEKTEDAQPEAPGNWKTNGVAAVNPPTATDDIVRIKKKRGEIQTGLQDVQDEIGMKLSSSAPYPVKRISRD